MKEYGDPQILARYLEGLSDRLRSRRAQRGISRRTLSRLTGISDRYLSRLERGQANPSVEILWRIASELDIELHELITERPLVAVSDPGLLEGLQRLDITQQKQLYDLMEKHLPPPERHYHGVALIGLRGAGKTTLGNALGRKLGVPLVRLGEVVEKIAGMGLPEVFSLGGQKSYRRLERQAVDLVIRKHNCGVLLEAGGSVVSELETFNTLKSSFYTVWIKATPEEHMLRVVDQGDLRPIQSTSEAMADLKRILAEREPRYKQANYALDTSSRSIEDCLSELHEVCKGYMLPPDRRINTAPSI